MRGQCVRSVLAPYIRSSWLSCLTSSERAGKSSGGGKARGRICAVLDRITRRVYCTLKTFVSGLNRVVSFFFLRFSAVAIQVGTVSW